MSKLNELLKKIEEKHGDLYKFEYMASCLLGKYAKIWYDDKFYIEVNNMTLEFTTISSVIDFIVNNVPDDYTNNMDIFPIMAA